MGVAGLGGGGGADAPDVSRKVEVLALLLLGPGDEDEEGAGGPGRGGGGPPLLACCGGLVPGLASDGDTTRSGAVLPGSEPALGRRVMGGAAVGGAAGLLLLLKLDRPFTDCPEGCWPSSGFRRSLDCGLGGLSSRRTCIHHRMVVSGGFPLTPPQL